VRGVSSNALNVAASISLALPAGTLPGDLLLAVVGHQGGTARNMTPPAGWTAVPSADYAQATNARIHAWYRFAGSDEPASYTFTLTGGSGQDTAGGILAIAGASAAGPIAASLGQANGTNSTSVTAPSVAPSVANALLVFGGSANGAVTFTPPAGMTEQLDRGTTGTYKVATAVATQPLAAAGATGTRVATISSAVKSAAIAIAIAPS
jgi:MSHA biogenesis protein MshQ